MISLSFDDPIYKMGAVIFMAQDHAEWWTPDYWIHYWCCYGYWWYFLFSSFTIVSLAVTLLLSLPISLFHVMADEWHQLDVHPFNIYQSSTLLCARCFHIFLLLFNPYNNHDILTLQVKKLKLREFVARVQWQIKDWSSDLLMLSPRALFLESQLFQNSVLSICFLSESPSEYLIYLPLLPWWAFLFVS